jgi:hypothetical protein
MFNEEIGLSFQGDWCSLRVRHFFSALQRNRRWYDERGRPEVHTEYFPPTITRQKPSWRRQFLPIVPALNAFNELMDEIYSALAQESLRLAAMGIRALVERLMLDQVGDRGSFEKNIAAFFAAGHVALNLQATFKDTLIEAGHAAMHRDFEPTADTINTLLDIVEGVMHTVYYAPVLADAAKKTIPPRP